MGAYFWADCEIGYKNASAADSEKSYTAFNPKP